VNPAAAAWLGLGLTFAAQNCNSLNMISSSKNQDLKISAICEYKADIIFLSDTRLNGRDNTVMEKLKLGVAVLFSNRLDTEIMDTVKDTHENILLLRIRINGIDLIVGSVYGPNTDNCDEFFNKIKNTVRD
jgi:hypothetical protein